MCVLIPFTNKLFNLGLEVLFRCEISDSQAFALEDAEPLLHVIHPGAMHRREMHHKAGMLGKPLAYVSTMMPTDIVTDEMNRLDGFSNLTV